MMCLITINLGKYLQTMVENRPTKAFEPGKYTNTKNVYLKTQWTEFHQVTCECSGDNYYRNLKCHADWCKWAWCTTYLLKPQYAFE